MCHGHKYNVKSSLLPITYKGKEVGADIVLFGHTHRAYLDEIDGMTIMNPGSVSGYGIIEIIDDKICAKVEKYE